MKRSRGFTLIELMVVIGITATFLAGTTAVLHRLFQSERSVRDSVQEVHSIARLAEQVRLDAYFAESAELVTGSADAANALELKLDDVRTVTYSIADHRIDRLARERDEVTHRERFPLRTSVRSAWRVQSISPHAVVELKLSSEDKNWTIQAVIGRIR